MGCDSRACSERDFTAMNAMRSTEVEDAELTLASYENVSRLKVAMNHTALVGVRQSCADLLD
jgi:hypothetical protein